MSRTVLGLSLVIAAASTGCLLKGGLSSKTASSAASPKESCTDQPIDTSYYATTSCLHDKVGQTFSFTCKPFEVSRFNFVTGGDPFAASTSLCWAAAYLGKIDPAVGGPIKVEIVAERNEYPAGELRNGIKSQAYKSTSTSSGFRFVE